MLSGDLLAIRRRKARPGALAKHCLQLVEADRICNPLGEIDRPGFAGGIETDPDGAPIAYHVASRHPLEFFAMTPLVWNRVTVYGEVSGTRRVRHLAQRRRPDQLRGVPYLAGVIEPLRKLDRYGSNELTASVIASLFTVFLKSEFADDLLPATPQSGTDSAGNALPPHYKIGPGAMLKLLPGEDIVVANPGRPNALFTPFVEAHLQQIGSALELPYEMLIKRFMASYSASRASRLEAWKFLTCVRLTKGRQRTKLSWPA